jgi:carbon storage regulator
VRRDTDVAEFASPRLADGSAGRTARDQHAGEVLAGLTSIQAPYPGRSLHMLVLSRQRDETIMIGDDIEVTVVDIRGDKVRLGINAPKEISVHRKEVYDAIRRENRAAAQVKPEDLSGLGKIGPKQQGEPKDDKK